VIFETPDVPVDVPGGGQIQDRSPAFSAMTTDIVGLEKHHGVEINGTAYRVTHIGADEEGRTRVTLAYGAPVRCSRTSTSGADMARESRLRRDLPVDIDVDAIWRIAEHIGATHKQFRAAYSRALKRTAATLRKKAMADLKDGLAPRSINLVRRRLLSFRLDRASQSQLDNFRLWFGLNAIKVKDLKGRINGRVRPHHTRRDKSTGRYIKARRQAENAGFTPKGSLLSPRTFENGEVARSRRENRRTVVIRDPDTRRTREAEVDIYEPMLNYIEDNAFAEAMEIFMHHFETDLRGRVKARISV